MPLRPPQIIKFQLAPCQRPPRSIVFIELMLVTILRLASGFTAAQVPTAIAMTPTAAATQTLPERNIAMRAMEPMHTQVPTVPLRLPPRGI